MNRLMASLIRVAATATLFGLAGEWVVLELTGHWTTRPLACLLPMLISSAFLETARWIESMETK